MNNSLLFSTSVKRPVLHVKAPFHAHIDYHKSKKSLSFKRKPLQIIIFITKSFDTLFDTIESMHPPNFHSNPVRWFTVQKFLCAVKLHFEVIFISTVIPESLSSNNHQHSPRSLKSNWLVNKAVTQYFATSQLLVVDKVKFSYLVAITCPTDYVFWSSITFGCR